MPWYPALYRLTGRQPRILPKSNHTSAYPPRGGGGNGGGASTYGPTNGVQWVRDNAGPRVVTDPGGTIPFDNTSNIHTLINSNPAGSTFLGAGNQTYTRTVTLSDRGKNPTIVFLPGAVLNGPGNAAGNIDAVSFTNGTIRGGKWQNFTSGLVGYAGSVFEDLEVLNVFNVGVGFLDSNVRLTRGWLHSNGKYGITSATLAGTSTDVVIEYCRVNDNNTRQLDPLADAGSSKFLFAHGMTMRYCWFHDNYGFGPWWDTNCVNIDCQENVIENNRNSGIFYEASGGGTVFARNALFNNADTLAVGGNNANFQISSGDGAAFGGSNGLILIQRNWLDGNGAQASLWMHNGHAVGEGLYCRGVHVEDNDIWLRGTGTSRVGGSNPGGEFVGKDIQWTANRYGVSGLSVAKWHWDTLQFTPKTWAEWQALGFDLAGTRVVI